MMGYIVSPARWECWEVCGSLFWLSFGKNCYWLAKTSLWTGGIPQGAGNMHPPRSRRQFSWWYFASILPVSECADSVTFSPRQQCGAAQQCIDNDHPICAHPIANSTLKLWCCLARPPQLSVRRPERVTLSRALHAPFLALMWYWYCGSNPSGGRRRPPTVSAVPKHDSNLVPPSPLSPSFLELGRGRHKWAVINNVCPITWEQWSQQRTWRLCHCNCCVICVFCVIATASCHWWRPRNDTAPVAVPAPMIDDPWKRRRRQGRVNPRWNHAMHWHGPAVIINHWPSIHKSNIPNFSCSLELQIGSKLACARRRSWAVLDKNCTY